MFSRTALLLAPLVLSVSACATSFSAADLSPAQIPDLERAVAEDSADAAAWARLGVAYGMADRPSEALEALERAVATPGAPTAAWAHLGTWREETGDFEGAAEAYRRYLEEGGDAAVETVEARLMAVEREILRLRAREALATESALNDEPPDPSTVGVLPLMVDGPEQYQPLGVGLAELLTTDLSLTDRLDVVERAQLSVLVEEMKLSLGGFTDRASAARVGRLLRAGRLVQGRIAITEEDGGARMDALVLNAELATSAGEANESGPLETLMDLEVQIALQIYRQLGVELTPAERARLEEKPTQNLQAFLAYSEGLQLLDRGAYDAAAGRFEAAMTMDPAFAAARQARQRAEGAARSSTETVSEAVTTETAALAVEAPAAVQEASVDQLVDATVPAGVSTTSTGAGSSGSTSSSGQSTTTENTETTAGTGVGKVVRIPIVLVRPRPSIFVWRIP